MAFCIVMGSQEFTKRMQEYPRTDYQCRNCGNFAAHCRKSWTWFTVCFIPVIPFSMGWHRDVYCPVCRWPQPLKERQDITGGGGQGQQLQPPGIGGYGSPAPQQQGYGGPQPPPQGGYYGGAQPPHTQHK